MEIEKVKSWYIINEEILFKVTDKTFLEHSSTGIPRLIVRHCLGADSFESKTMSTQILHNGELFDARFVKKYGNRMVLVFDSKLRDALLLEMQKFNEKNIVSDGCIDELNFPLVQVILKGNIIEFILIDPSLSFKNGLKMMFPKN